MTGAVAWTVLAPLSSGCLCVLLPARLRAGLAAVAGAVTSVAAVVLAATVRANGAGRYRLGGWGAPIGIELHADGLAATLLLTTAGVCLAVGAYAAGYFGRGAPGPATGQSLWPLGLFLWAGLNALFLSADLFNLYVCLEVVALAAVGLVVVEDDPAALVAAVRYLLASFLASTVLLLGIALLYAAYGVLDLGLLAEQSGSGPSTALGLALITVALTVKAALFPLHFWLPRAHASAPPPVSAVLSALVVTGPYYVVLRLWLEVFPTALGTARPGQLLGALGVAAICWGSLQAVRQRHLKPMVAYSTVAQMGYLFVVFPLASGPWAHTAWTGAIYQAVSHAFAKAGMFLSVGAIARALGNDRVAGVRGIATQLPLSTYAFGLAGMSLIGLPPSGGFVAKWQLLIASFRSGQWWWGVAILVGGILTASYVFLVLGQELSQAEEDDIRDFRPVPRVMELAAFSLALAAFLLGLLPVAALELLGVGAPFSPSPAP